MTETYGYIRVSSTDQNESRQRSALEQQGIPSGHIFMDKMSGKDFSVRSIRPCSKNSDRGINSALRALTGSGAIMRKFWNSGAHTLGKSAWISSF